jgi:hypothetical protein
MIYLESDDPALSLEEIRSIFNKLDLQALFVGQTYKVASSPSATQPIHP